MYQRAINDGACHISADVAQHTAASDPLRIPRPGVEALSRRRIQVLQRIASGVACEDSAARSAVIAAYGLEARPLRPYHGGDEGKRRVQDF